MEKKMHHEEEDFLQELVQDWHLNDKILDLLNRDQS
jgi:hypothetical protein